MRLWWIGGGLSLSYILVAVLVTIGAWSPGPEMKSITLPDILTEAQIAHALQLYQAHGMDAVAKIQAAVIEPNMAAINEKLGQANSARYLAFAVVYVFSKEAKVTGETIQNAQIHRVRRAMLGMPQKSSYHRAILADCVSALEGHKACRESVALVYNKMLRGPATRVPLS